MNKLYKILLTSLFFIVLLVVWSQKHQDYLYFSLENLASSQQQHEEKFITYLPHSGLHNQRISLNNALITAKILNRTLLMPPINLGADVPWRPYRKLSKQLSGCADMAHVRDETRNTNITKCARSPDFTQYAVDQVFDLSSAHQLDMRTEQRTTMQMDYLKKHYLERHPAESNDTDISSKIYTMYDTDRYEYQLYDNENAVKDMKYKNHIDFNSLMNQKELYIEFGSLFGSTRLALDSSRLNNDVEKLNLETGISNPDVKNVTQQVYNLLGKEYVGLHFRLGNGSFKKNVTENLATMIKELETRLNQTESNSMFTSQEQPPRDERLKSCLSQQQSNTPKSKMIYLATDSRNPRKELTPLFAKYACIFTLNDFQDIIQAINVNTTKIKVDQLIPLMDADIASQSQFFIGTKDSTFSEFIQARQHYHEINKKNR